jgi:hypothetical protein
MGIVSRWQPTKRYQRTLNQNFKYLRVERQFRGLFDAVRREDWSTMPSFEINLKNAPTASYWRAVGSWSIVGFYAPLTVGVIILVLLARLAHVE